MSEERNADEELVFGERLLGMQGFSATRARRYRAELETLLVHRLSKLERWTAGFMGIVTGTALGGAVIAALNREDPITKMFPEMRWAVAGAFLASGIILAGWMLWIAFRGGFGRRLADTMGLAIMLTFCGGFACIFFSVAWDVDDTTRTKFLLGGATVVACLVGCTVMTMMQRMHRQTQEKLLRIEYHMAELMERTPESRWD
jgi:hypothetical protein